MEERLDRIEEQQVIITVEDLRSSLRDIDDVDRAKIAEAIAGKRFVKILETPQIFIYLGVNEDHIVIPRTFCSCSGFIIQVLGEGKKKHCSHLAALEHINDHHYIDISGKINLDTVLSILLEVLYYQRTKTLRRMIYDEE